MKKKLLKWIISKVISPDRRTLISESLANYIEYKEAYRVCARCDADHQANDIGDLKDIGTYFSEEFVLSKQKKRRINKGLKRWGMKIGKGGIMRVLG